MANSFLSPTAVTREALRVLHNNIVFAKNCNRQYDSSFANSGATMSGKIGPSLRVRKPNRYTVRTGAPIALQDATEAYETITVSTQKGIDMHFSSQDLTLSIDEFSARYIAPAMAALASQLDFDGLTLAKDVYNTAGVTTVTSDPAHTFPFLRAGQLMDNGAAPRDNMRSAIVNAGGQAAMVSGLTALFNSTSAIGKQYDTGAMGDALGFTFKMSQNVNTMTCGTRVASGTQTVTGANQTGTTLNITGSNSQTYKKGDVFTIVSGTAVNSVNPETKQSTGIAQQFTVTADVTGSGSDGTAALTISPAITISGATQTVTASPDNSAQITFYGAASASYPLNLCYHKDAFALVTADLEMPKGVDFAARESYDGISMRVVRQYDINNDKFPCRIDLLYGWKTLYPEWACRVIGDSTTLV
jgi:hypothetical protein